MWTEKDRERYKGDGRRYPSDLTDAEWELVRSSVRDLPDPDQGHPCDGRRLSLPGAEGCRWRSLPKDFGPWQTVRGYWDRFHRDGVWADVAAAADPGGPSAARQGPAPSTGIVDAQSVVRDRRKASAA